MRLKLIACEILFRELSLLAAKSCHTIDPTFLPKGLHDIGRTRMSARLREAVEAVDESQYDAIVLGYALCSGGVTEIRAGTIPIVVPRAHDCITLFLGDRRRYLDFFFANPGTYFKTPGWIERGGDLVQSVPWNIPASESEDANSPMPTSATESTPAFLGNVRTYEDFVQRYGEENARYLWEELGRMKHYMKLAYIKTGVEPDDRFERETQRLASQNGWSYEKLSGDLSLLRRLLEGDWNEDDFLVVSPGKTIQFDYGDAIIRCEPAD